MKKNIQFIFSVFFILFSFFTIIEDFYTTKNTSIGNIIFLLFFMGLTIKQLNSRVVTQKKSIKRCKLCNNVIKSSDHICTSCGMHYEDIDDEAVLSKEDQYEKNTLK